MNKLTLLVACFIIAPALTFAGAAGAAIIAFSGTRANIDAPGPAAARCGARMTANIRNSANSSSTGTSNLGAFDATLSHCIQLPLPAIYDLGDFAFDFAAGDSLFGTQSGSLTFNAPGLFNNLQTYIVTGGTGRFLNASGAFTGTGTLSFLEGPPRGQQSFSGTLNLPAVPEPASWLMMIMGFGLTGFALRSRTPRAHVVDG